MLHYLSYFLQNRRFQVVVNGFLSEIKTQENGVPQGETISVTLFLLAINNIISSLPPEVKFYLFADDLVIYTESKHLQDIQIKLQKAIKKT